MQPLAPPTVSAASESGSSRFVAVLASKKSREDALNALAQLQQKYAEVLYKATSHFAILRSSNNRSNGVVASSPCSHHRPSKGTTQCVLRKEFNTGGASL
jgi:hypothetical protein